MNLNENTNSYTARCGAISNKFRSLSSKDVCAVGLYCTEPPEQISALSEAENRMLFDGERKRLYGYCTSVVEMCGEIDLKKFLVNYNSLVRSEPILRTNYITDGVTAPLRIINAVSPRIFPIFTIASLPASNRRDTVANAVNAETTRIYRPQSDSILMLRGYLTASDRITAIISIRAASELALSAEDVAQRVFSSMTVDKISSPEQINAVEFSDEAASQISKKEAYFSHSALFSGCSKNDLARLSECSRIQTYGCDNIISEEKRAVSELGIVLSGKIEESKTGAGGVIKSICVRKAGNIFLVESLLDNNISAFTYSAIENGTEILWIRRQSFIRAADACPSVWAALLGDVHVQEQKIKRLWTIL